jgi:hypothetical protein
VIALILTSQPQRVGIPLTFELHPPELRKRSLVGPLGAPNTGGSYQ